MIDELVIGTRDGGELALRRSGVGTPLALVHGGVVSKEAWVFVEPLLAERHEVWSYDRRGHGASPEATDLSFEREIEDVEAVLATAGTEVHLVGHSDGALLSLEAAARQPQLRSLVLYEPAVHFDQRDDAFRRATAKLAAGDLEGFLDVFLPEIAAASPDEIAMMRSLPDVWTALLDGARRYAAHRDEIIDRVERLSARSWPPDPYRLIVVPTLLVIGELTQSPLFATAEDIRQAIPHAEVAAIEGQGHMAASFDPAGFADAVLSFTAAQDS